MATLTDYFPTHVWAVAVGLALFAVAGIFVPPSATARWGLSLVEHIIAVGIVQFTSAVGIAALVVAYRQPGPDDSEWRYGP